MPNYFSSAEAVERFEYVCDAYYMRESVIQTAWIDADIEGAEGLIDSYLSALYATPVSDPVHLRVVRMFTEILWLYAAYRRGSAADIPESAAEDRKMVLEQLKLIASGKMKLGGSEPDIREELNQSVVISGNTAEMTRNKLSRF